jgi:hypothetical protein
MDSHAHWLPPLISKAKHLDKFGEGFMRGQILNHVVNGRVFAEIHPHRADDKGTRSLRFSYSHPALQQTPKHDEELAPRIRRVFLPEEGEVWASCDLSQQEFRLIVHYAIMHRLPGALEAAERYRRDPNTDFHAYASELTGGLITRQQGKTLNFAKAYGAGETLQAKQLGISLDDAKRIIATYDQKIQFVSALGKVCKMLAHQNGYFVLSNGARRHFNRWAPGGKYEKGAAPCERDEAISRVTDRTHPWYGKQLFRADAFKAFNIRIQSDAAVQTKIWMREVYRAGVVPLLQMHDALELSVPSAKIAERVAQLGEAAVTYKVPMKVDSAFGRNWGDAKHSWSELQGEPEPTKPVKVTTIAAPAVGHDGFDGYTEEVENSYKPKTIRCPFHEEKTASCHVYADGHYHCFGCGAHGFVDEDFEESMLAELSIGKANGVSAAWMLSRAQSLWDEAEPISNTLAARYFVETRKLDLAALPIDVDAALRYHSRCPFTRQTTRPCVLALFRDVESDMPAGIHRIALTPDARKLDRLTLGEWPTPRAIKLWTPTDQLTIGEGIETTLGALCCGAAAPPAWSLGSRVNIAKFPVLPTIMTLTILVDHDGQALADAKDCATRWVAAGRTVRLLRTIHVKDFNDLVMA